MPKKKTQKIFLFHNNKINQNQITLNFYPAPITMGVINKITNNKC